METARTYFADEGEAIQQFSYDAWGNSRDPYTWTGSSTEAPMFDRGYTGHEHMTAFGLINMNGRCYDPMMSSFLSVDAYLQDPTSAQNFNRYAYCAYNPLRYTDPTGWEMGSGNGNLPDDYPPIPDGTYVLPEVPIIADGVNSSSGGYNPQGTPGTPGNYPYTPTIPSVPDGHSGTPASQSGPSYYPAPNNGNNGNGSNGGHGTGGNIGGGNNQSSRTLNTNGKKPENNIHSASSSIVSAAVPVALTCAAVDGPAPGGDLIGVAAGVTLLAASGIVWIGEELLDLYENLNGKNEQHGDNGRAIGKAESQIGELENQLKNAKSKKEKEKINRKIANIKKTAQKKKKGENHSNGNKR